MRRLSYRYQRTIARSVAVPGVGFLTGANVRLCFRPAPPDTGIVFVRTDLKNHPQIAARAHYVTSTHRRTTLGHPPAQVSLVEHVLAALAGLRIDNCYVELDAPEPPGLDGSAGQFVQALRQAGCVLQAARRAVWTVSAPVVVTQPGASLALHPAEDDSLRISYILDYGLGSPIGWQIRTELITPELFAQNLARARTFLLDREAVELRQQGLGARTTPADLVIFGPRGPIANRLRFADEPARHKILDIVGDLSLFGHDLRGHVVAYRSGHPLNVELARTLVRQLPAPAGCRRRQAA
ncbi:MAG: UDP-3-O-acyl-N-acetylglucosamine deacetylase [Gemmataceae bacterium]|nr:UDP-3-O-acyl-N-acetylglucosamine deacetylase [Gemmataceae bacterium]MDW8266226.1 UDP-3-O-acyl-N-acetylglucosamine deacetylase [Gemmataceae bacterium]